MNIEEYLTKLQQLAERDRLRRNSKKDIDKTQA